MWFLERFMAMMGHHFTLLQVYTQVIPLCFTSDSGKRPNDCNINPIAQEQLQRDFFHYEMKGQRFTLEVLLSLVEMKSSHPNPLISGVQALGSRRSSFLGSWVLMASVGLSIGVEVKSEG